jgi:hypothetical protein
MDRGRCGYDLVGNKCLREKAVRNLLKLLTILTVIAATSKSSSQGEIRKD